MKKVIFCLAFLGFGSNSLKAQNDLPSSVPNLASWEIGISFGEIPILAKSFKAGISIGYHFNDYVYVGALYQIEDKIERNDQSFDAMGLGFEPLISSKETVAPRAILHARLRPHRNAPFITIGMVYNGLDRENIEFGNAEHQIGNNSYSGPLSVSLSRAAAFRPVMGIGYSYAFSNGLTLSTEWSFDWFNRIPSPDITMSSPDFNIDPVDFQLKEAEIIEDFRGNFHNRYHIFHLGLGYKF